MSSVQSIESQRSQIFALLSAGWSGARIAEHLQNLHGDNSLKKTAVYSWIERFKDGQATVSDLPRPGRPESSSNKKLRQQIETLLDSDARCRSGF
jgi:transposase